MERSEIRWYKFGSPDKKRPVLILTRTSAIKFLGEITVAPITLTVRDIPTEIVLNENDGMKTTCAVNFDHIQTVSKVKIGSYITKLSEKKIHQVKPALLFAFGFD
ncbi:MAG: type II toxin-antitoxin system PemK/MazF family toxin [Actinobacteria bacterium]|nr:type II toxin-antitoxin system PemK/MazF family toxin [Actinomycetota bacterium]